MYLKQASMNIDDINTSTQMFIRLIKSLLWLLTHSSHCVTITGDYLSMERNLICTRRISLFGWHACAWVCLRAGERGETECVFPV